MKIFKKTNILGTLSVSNGIPEYLNSPMIKKGWIYLCLIGTFSFVSSCNKEVFNPDLDYDFQGQEWAIPLINTQLSVERMVSEAGGNVTIKLDEEGKATIQYRGEVLRENSAKIFPPLPFLEPFYITGDTTIVDLFPGNPNNVDIAFAVFKGTQISFVVETEETEDIDVTITIPQLTLNGNPFQTTFRVVHSGQTSTRFQTPLIDIDKWEIRTVNNLMSIIAQAVRKDGSPATMSQAYMTYDFIRFSYIEGYHGYHRFPIKGNFINISLFNNWLSGGFDFQDPKISLIVDNAFGIPVRTEVEKLELTSINGNTVNLESDFIETGINFLYPGFDEVGAVKTTVFNFDKDNSNIRELFNEKTKTITYQINALINPDRDKSIQGFITDSSFYVVNVAAEVPLLGSVRELVVTDTLDITLDSTELFDSAEFKVVLSHDFPADVRLDVIFTDDQGIALDSLFGANGMALLPAVLSVSGRTESTTPQTFFIPVDKDRFSRIQKASQVIINGFVNTTDSERNRPLWIYGDYGFDIKVGVRAKINPK